MASAVVSDNFETSGGGVPQLGGTGATTCKAWVNFNGTGTVAIRDSHNVSSITDNGTGNWTVTFSSAFANTNYTAIATSEIGGGNGGFNGSYLETSTSCNVIAYTNAGASRDLSRVYLNIFSN